jgi:hypothetical protein
VTDLGQYSYRVRVVLDSPANGGNGDGVVCGKPVSPAEEEARFANETGVPIIFDFRDNNLQPFQG